MNKFLNLLLLSLLLLPLGQVMRRPQYTSWTPPSQSGLQVWMKNESGAYDATSGGSAVTSDGSTVKRWEDQSGNSNHVTEGTNPPVLKTGANGINGYAVMRFDGTNDLLSKSSWSTSGSSWTLFVVWKSSDTSYCIIETQAVDSWWRFSGNGDGYFAVFLSTRLENTPSAMPSSGTHYLVARATSGGTYEVYLDGASKATTSSFTFASPTRIEVGRNSDGTGAKYLDGDIAEFGMYNVDSSTLRDNLNTYMATKYGL